MPPVVLLAHGSNPAERQRSIDQIKRWIRLHDPTGIDADTVQTMYDWTEDNAATAGYKQTQDSYLYVVTDADTARDRQGPDDPVHAACSKVTTEDNANLIVDTLAGVPVDYVTALTNEHGARVYDVTHQISLTPDPAADDVPTATRRALDVLTGTAEHADALLAGIEWLGGRPPLGCTSNDGRLAPADDYDKTCRVLQKVKDGDLSKTRAADKLACARKTIDNALDRPELYRLE